MFDPTPILTPIKEALSKLPERAELETTLRDQWQLSALSAAVEARDKTALPTSILRRATIQGEVNFELADRLISDQFDLEELQQFLEVELQVAIAVRDLKTSIQSDGADHVFAGPAQRMLFANLEALVDRLDPSPETDSTNGKTLRTLARTEVDALMTARKDTLRALERYRKAIEEPVLDQIPTWARPLQESIQQVIRSVVSFDAERAFLRELPTVWKLENDPIAKSEKPIDSAIDSLSAAVQIVAALRESKKLRPQIEAVSPPIHPCIDRYYQAVEKFLDSFDLEANEEGSDLRHLAAVGRARLREFTDASAALKVAAAATLHWLSPIDLRSKVEEVRPISLPAATPIPTSPPSPSTIVTPTLGPLPPTAESEFLAATKTARPQAAVAALLERYGVDRLFDALDALVMSGQVSEQEAPDLLELLSPRIQPIDAEEAPVESKTRILANAAKELAALKVEPELAFKLLAAVRTYDVLGRAGLLNVLLRTDPTQTRSTLNRVFDTLEENRLLKREDTGGRGKGRSGRYVFPNTTNGIKAAFPATCAVIDGLRADPDYLK